MTFTCPLQDFHEQYINCKVNEVCKFPQNASDEFMCLFRFLYVFENFFFSSESGFPEQPR
jgi:hypothetical protein